MIASFNRFIRNWYNQATFYQVGIFAFIIILVARLVSLGFPGLVDPSDARYTVIAENMIRSGDWISIKAFEKGALVPYWSKPPLVFWLMAVSESIFGLTPWAARLPSFLATFFTALLIHSFAKKHFSKEIGILASCLYVSSALIFAFAGVAMLDSVLTLFITALAIELYEYICCDASSKRWYRIALFAALGFLTKGPLALFFPALFSVPWVVIKRKYKIFLSLHFFLSIVLFFVIVTPWFYLHELRNPGFLKYFLIEENFHRFSSHTDKLLNGSLHPTPRGVAIPFFFLALLPALLFLCFSTRTYLVEIWRKQNEVLKILLIWAIAPVIFLALGKQVLIYYILPAIPPAVIIISLFIQSFKKKYLLMLTFFGCLLGVVTITTATSIENKKSTKILFEELSSKSLIKNEPLYFFVEAPDSAYHYAPWFIDNTTGRYSNTVRVIREQELPILKHGIVISRSVNEQKLKNIIQKDPEYVFGKWRVFLIG